MTKRPTNRRYREWVCGHPCAVDGCTRWDTEPHHLKGDQWASGVGLKSPELLLMPLCNEHHRHIQEHRPGWREMQREALLLTLVQAAKDGWLVLADEIG